MEEENNDMYKKEEEYLEKLWGCNEIKLLTQLRALCYQICE